MWLVLRGELSVFKRLESLFDEQGRLVDLRNLKLFSDPLHAGHQNLGARVGVFKSISLVCEDAVMFQQPLIYSLKTKSQVLAWRYPRVLALLHFPNEIKD